MIESFQIREARDVDHHEISNLAERNGLLLDGLTPEIFRRSLRRLHTNSVVDKRLQLLAHCSQGVIAHYGGISFNMKFYGNKLSAVLASNLVVDKDYRMQSPFFALQKEFIKSYPLKNYSFAYGAITREGVLNPHLRMGWKSLGTLRVYIRPIALNSIFSKLINIPMISTAVKFPLKLIQLLWDLIYYHHQKMVKIEEVTSFDDSISFLLDDWMKKKKICSERSVESLNWRFSNFEDRDYRIFVSQKNSTPSGYLVARLMPMKQFLCIAIVDLVVLNDDKTSFNALMKKCFSIAREEKADLVASALTDHDILKNSFHRAGFFTSKEKFTIVGHFPKNGFINLSNFNFADFHMNWFDHDYV